MNLLGLQWYRQSDKLSVKAVKLDGKSSTKRGVLSTLAKNFDPFNFNGPLINRARLFMHKLQCDSSLKWDQKLSHDNLREWRNICKQLNNVPEIEIDRFVGKRNSNYRLIGFTDASKLMYGTVVYIQDMQTNEISFLLAKNRVVTHQLESKSIPSLEFQATVLGVETLRDTYKDLTERINGPINIEEIRCYTDSMVVINWINSYTHKYDKLQAKRGIFVMNRLNRIATVCADCPMTFSFVAGVQNSADFISRAVSYKQLKNSCYFSGPAFLKQKPEMSTQPIIDIIVPNPQSSSEFASCEVNQLNATVTVAGGEVLEHLVPVNKYSGLHRLVAVHGVVLKFVNKLKQRLKDKNPTKYNNLKVLGPRENYCKIAWMQIIKRDQGIHFKECIDYFAVKNPTIKSMPNVIGQLNVVPDPHGILRVHGKCDRGKFRNMPVFPIMLSKDSALTRLLINDVHAACAHIGPYTLISELRKLYYISKAYSTVKKILKDCITCKRLNAKPVKLNQSSYREFRLDPPKVPFRSVFVDYFGPYEVKLEKNRTKVWILCITCLWTRAINLKLCRDQSMQNCLRGLQMHIHEYGLPQSVFSDLGTNIVATSNVIRDFLKDSETKTYLQQHDIKEVSFNHYYKGNSALGSLVESAVKLVKRLIYGAVGKNILNYFDFEFLVSNSVHLVNRRSVAFKDCIQSYKETVPEPITPAMLILGYTLPSATCVPNVEPDPEPEDWRIDPSNVVNIDYTKLKNVRAKSIDLYKEEFLASLIKQAINKKGRYTPVLHRSLQKGDVVLLKEKFTKPYKYPLGVVVDLQENELGEVAGAVVKKGSTNEYVKCHSSSLIPLLCCETTKDSASHCSLDPPRGNPRRSLCLADRRRDLK